MPSGTTAHTLAPSEEALDAPLSPPPLGDEPGPATGPSGTYPGGTYTHWSDATFRTHHGATVAVATSEQHHRPRTRFHPAGSPCGTRHDAASTRFASLEQAVATHRSPLWRANDPSTCRVAVGVATVRWTRCPLHRGNPSARKIYAHGSLVPCWNASERAVSLGVSRGAREVTSDGVEVVDVEAPVKRSRGSEPEGSPRRTRRP